MARDTSPSGQQDPLAALEEKDHALHTERSHGPRPGDAAGAGSRDTVEDGMTSGDTAK